MLTSLYQALVQQLSKMELPIFLADCVPDGTAFPYITAEIAAPLSAAEAGKVLLTLWCCSEAANAERLHLTDALLDCLPARGLRLALEGGAITLRMNGSAACVHSKDALGIRTVWTLRCYPSA